MHRVFLLAILIGSLAACGGREVDVSAERMVSRVEPAAAPGLTYSAFRVHPFNDGSEMRAVQKRFLTLDRDNNGLLTQDEFSGF